MTLRPTKTVIDRCVNVPARDVPGRNGHSWGSHMNPPSNSCINIGLSGRWAHDAHVWFFRTCRMRLDDAVGGLLTIWGRIQVCVCVRVCVSEPIWVKTAARHVFSTSTKYAMLALSIHACVLKKTDETNERIKSAGHRLIEYNLVAPSLQSCDWTWFALTRCKVRDVAVPHSRAAPPLLSSVSEKDGVAESATK